MRRSSLYVVETLSGGKLASRGAAESWFAGALVIPDSAALYRYLGIRPSGDPSVAITAAVRRLREQGSDYAFAQIAHFERGRLNDEMETVEVHFVLAAPDGVWRQTRTIGGDIERKQITATALSFDFLRRYFLRMSGLRAW